MGTMTSLNSAKKHPSYVSAISPGKIKDRGRKPSSAAGLPVLSGPKSPAVYDPLRVYLNEISRFKILSREEEESLAKRYKEYGDTEAARRLISANLRLVVKIAMEFQSYWLKNLLDLIQEGNLGLVQALNKFDPYRGVKFSYYASFWIKAHILKYIMDNWRLVKVGTTQAQRRLFYNLKKEQDKLLAEGFGVNPKLLAERLGVTASEVEEMGQRLAGGQEVSLDAPVSPDSSKTIMNTLSNDAPAADDMLANAQIRELLFDKLEAFKEHLSDRERLILQKRLLAEETVTLQEIGAEFGVSRERVRQLEERLLKKLRKFLMAELPGMDEYLSSEVLNR